MNVSKKILSIFSLIVFTSVLVAFNGKDPWSKNQIISPELLAQKLKLSKELQPMIINIGGVGSIKNSIEIGAMTEKENVAKLKKLLRNTPQTKEIVIYCGCCPFANCPNIRPAFNLLIEQHFTNAKLLNLHNNLKVNWIDKGFPMD